MLEHTELLHRPYL